MTIRPIIFSAPMVRALLEGRKTQTRRIIKVPGVMGGMYPIHSPERPIELSDGEFRAGVFHYESTGALSGPYRLPCAVGDLLYVREAHAFVGGGDPGVLLCAADWQERACELGLQNREIPPQWKPSIHQPRWASRLTLAVTDVRVQRLQDISDKDAMAEGVATVPAAWDIGVANMDSKCCPERIAFRVLWNSLHGPGAWDQNPWVVAVTFTVHKCNVDQFADGGKMVAAC